MAIIRLRFNSTENTLFETLGEYVLFHAVLSVMCCRQAVLKLRRLPQESAGETLEPRWDHNLFYAVLSMICCGLTVFKLRRLPQGQARETRRSSPTLEPRGDRNGLPPIGDNALLWKELNVAQGTILRPFFWLVMLLLALVGFLGLNQTRHLGVPMATCALFVVGLSAAGRVCQEREKQTLDTLLTTAQEPRDILYAKWLASLLAARHFLWFLVPVWFLGLISGGLHVIALPLVLMAWMIYAAFVASVGLWFSTVCNSSLRATMFTLATLSAIILPSIIPVYSIVASASAPFALWLLSFGYDGRLELYMFGGSLYSFGFVFVWLFVYAAAALCIWESCCQQIQVEGRGMKVAP